MGVARDPAFVPARGRCFPLVKTTGSKHWFLKCSEDSGDRRELTVKHRLREMLRDGDFDGLVDAAVRKRRILGSLVSQIFDPEPLICWRAIEAMGLAAGRIAEDDPDYVREHLRRLNWMLTEESGGICWRAPEAIAEIVRHRPKLFVEFIPIVVFLLLNMAEEDLDHFRTGILWAIGRLGALAGDHIPAVLPAITSALDDPDAQARGMAAWCLGQVGRADLLRDHPNLLSDEGPVDLYENRDISHTTVRQVVRLALRSGSAEG